MEPDYRHPEAKPKDVEIASPHGFAWGLKAHFARNDDYVIARS